MGSDSKIAAASKKVPFYVVPLVWLMGVARVFKDGSVKHGRENFYKGEDDPDTCDRYMGGVMRHMQQMQSPGGLYSPTTCIALDEESGLPHLDHAICGLLMLRARLVKAGHMPEDPGEGQWTSGKRKHNREVPITFTLDTTAPLCCFAYSDMRVDDPFYSSLKNRFWVMPALEVPADKPRYFQQAKGAAESIAGDLNAGKIAPGHTPGFHQMTWKGGMEAWAVVDMTGAPKEGMQHDAK